MKRPILIIGLVAIVVLFGAPSWAQPGAASAAAAAGNLTRLFPRQASVEVPAGTGLVRLPLPTAVLDAVKDDLSDLRLFDERGNIVPFMRDEAQSPLRPRQEARGRVGLPLRSVKRRRSWRRSDWRYQERFRVTTVALEQKKTRWILSLKSARPEFVAHVRVVAARDPDREIASGSFFRLRGPLREGLDLPLPAQLPPQMLVIIEGNDGYLEPDIRMFGRRPGEVEPTLTSLQLLSQKQIGQVTELELRRPRGISPQQLLFETATSSFHRHVSIEDAGQGARQGHALGQGTVFRVADRPGVAHLAVKLVAGTGERLRVRIDNGDSPALDGLTVQAAFDQPAILFTATGNVMLRFGGGRAPLPAYDVQSFGRSAAGRARVRATEQRQARLLEIRPNPDFDTSPALSFLLKPAAQVDLSAYTHVRAVTVGATREGLSRLRLAADDLAAGGAELADLRIVDGEDRQRPYLIERAQQPLQVQASVSAPETRNGRSQYRIKLPHQPLPITRLTLEATEQYVDRDYKVIVLKGGREQVLASGRLRRLPHSDKLLAIDIADTEWHLVPRFADLRLILTDGDDAPLAFHSAQLEIATADIYLAAEEGEYRMLLGRSDATAPRYEMSRVRDLVLALPSVEAKTQALKANAAYAPKVEKKTPRGLLWGSLGLAVLVLAGLTLRAAREEQVEPAEEDVHEEPAEPTAEGDAPEEPVEPTVEGEPPEEPVEPAAEGDAPEEPAAPAPDEPPNDL